MFLPDALWAGSTPFTGLVVDSPATRTLVRCLKFERKYDLRVLAVLADETKARAPDDKSVKDSWLGNLE